MKVLVTGATGFIGSRLVAYLHERGHQVVALGQANNAAEESRLQQLSKVGIEIEEIPLSAANELKIALKGCARVYHLAAAQHEANVPDSHFWTVNVDGVRALIELSIAAGVDRFIHGSTIGVYGDMQESALNEQSPPRPKNIYGVTKLEGEKLALSYCDQVFITAVRISETYGPGDGRLLKLFRAIDSGSFMMIGAGKNLRQPIYVDDLVAGICLSGETDRANGQVFVLAGNEILSTRETVQCIAETLGKRVRSWRLPIWPFLVVAWLLEQSLGRLGIQPPLHRRRLDFFRKSFIFDTQKATEVVGFVPKTTFREGAKETARWYRAHGAL